MKYTIVYLCKGYYDRNKIQKINSMNGVKYFWESILCTLCIFTNSILYFIQDAYICNFADDNDNLLYSTVDNFKEVQTISKKKFELLQVWF